MSSHWRIRSSKVLLFQGLKAKIAEYDIFEHLPRHRGIRARTAVASTIGTTFQYLPPEYVLHALLELRFAISDKVTWI